MRLPIRVVELVLPYPPPANKYWRLFTPKGRGAHPRMIVSELGRAYKALVRGIVRKKVAGTLTGSLRFSADVFRPRAAGDVDSHSKVLLDALQRDEEENWPGLYLNDGQGFSIRVERWDHQPKNPRVQLTVTEDPNPREPPRDWPLSRSETAELEHARAALAAIRAKENARAKERKALRDTLGAPATPGERLKALARPASYTRKRGERA